MFVVAIVGPNGVGKTSLLNLLLGILTPVRSVLCVCVHAFVCVCVCVCVVCVCVCVCMCVHACVCSVYV